MITHSRLSSFLPDLNHLPYKLLNVLVHYCLRVKSSSLNRGKRASHFFSLMWSSSLSRRKILTLLYPVLPLPTKEKILVRFHFRVALLRLLLVMKRKERERKFHAFTLRAFSSHRERFLACIALHGGMLQGRRREKPEEKKRLWHSFLCRDVIHSTIDSPRRRFWQWCAWFPKPFRHHISRLLLKSKKREGRKASAGTYIRVRMARKGGWVDGEVDIFPLVRVICDVLPCSLFLSFSFLLSSSSCLSSSSISLLVCAIFLVIPPPLSLWIFCQVSLR